VSKTSFSFAFLFLVFSITQLNAGTSFPILDTIESSGGVLSKNTKKWMNKWNKMDLENSAKFQFKEIWLIRN
jgi:hypothetical protein